MTASQVLRAEVRELVAEEYCTKYQGFNVVNTTRSPFRITGGQYQIDSHHATATVFIVLSRDGQTFGNVAVQQYTVTGLGTLCLPLTGVSGYSAGDNATLQVIYRASSESSNLVRRTPEM